MLKPTEFVPGPDGAEITESDAVKSILREVYVADFIDKRAVQILEQLPGIDSLYLSSVTDENWAYTGSLIRDLLRNGFDEEALQTAGSLLFTVDSRAFNCLENVLARLDSNFLTTFGLKNLLDLEPRVISAIGSWENQEFFEYAQLNPEIVKNMDPKFAAFLTEFRDVPEMVEFVSAEKLFSLELAQLERVFDFYRVDKVQAMGLDNLLSLNEAQYKASYSLLIKQMKELSSRIQSMSPEEIKAVCANNSEADYEKDV